MRNYCKVKNLDCFPRIILWREIEITLPDFYNEHNLQYNVLRALDSPCKNSNILSIQHFGESSWCLWKEIWPGIRF